MNPPRIALPISRCCFGLVLLAALLGAGCGGASKGNVSGTVTYQGKPLPHGSVNFLSDQNEVLVSAAINEGKYTAFKVPAGPAKLTVSTPPQPKSKARPLSKKGPNWRKKPAPSGAEPIEEKAPPQKRTASTILIPAKYTDPNQSGLTYTVQPGDQVHNIELP